MLGSGLCPRDKGSSFGCGKVRSVIDSRLCFMMLETVRCSLADGDADALVLKV